MWRLQQQQHEQEQETDIRVDEDLLLLLPDRTSATRSRSTEEQVQNNIMDPPDARFGCLQREAERRNGRWYHLVSVCWPHHGDENVVESEFRDNYVCYPPHLLLDITLRRFLGNAV